MPTTQILPERNLGHSLGAPAHTLVCANPLDPSFSAAITPSARFIAWAGWLDPSGDPAAGIFPSDHRLWNEGLSRLRDTLASLAMTLAERGAILILRPACGLVLSDPHSVAALLKDPPTDRLRILVDPAAMLTPGMAEHAEDHLPRVLDKLGAFEACSGIVLAGGVPADADRLAHRPLDPARAFDRALLAAWRGSAFAERDTFVLTQACAGVLESARRG